MIVTFIDQKESKNNLIVYGRLNATPQDISGKGVFANVIKLRILGDDPELCGWPLNAHHACLYEREEREISHRRGEGNVTTEIR